MSGHDEKKGYPLKAVHYNLLEEIGQGVSATVYRAICLPFNEVVAVKCLDLEKCTSNLDEIRREAQTMSLICHPNVVKAFCSFVVDHSLWVVMPYLAGGSCLHVMKAAYPDGFEEPIISTLLKESLRALDYLHKHGHIHRDVKAGNILIDGNGMVKLGDFGVSACMFDTGDRQRSRNTFVGTPCWMAPEVMEQVHGYDFKADIWSFGITALELAHGHAPFSKYPPMKVLLMTLQNAPPGLDYERDKRFSKSFKEMIAMCLVKDPARRPSAEKLLKHSFFKNARSYEYVARHLLDGLPPLGERVRNLKLKDAARLAQKKMPYDEQQERSQNEYKRGVSCWNFNVEDLKAEAALIHENVSTAVNREEEDFDRFPPHHIAQSFQSPQFAVSSASDIRHLRESTRFLTPHTSIDVDLSDHMKREATGSCSTVLHLQGRFDLAKDIFVAGPSDRLECGLECDLFRKGGKEHRSSEIKELKSGRVFLDRSIAATKTLGDVQDSDKHHCQVRDVEDVFRDNVPSRDALVAEQMSLCSAARPISDQVSRVNEVLLTSKSPCLKDVLEEKSKGPLVQKKGRFSVTSEGEELVEEVQLHSLPGPPLLSDWLFGPSHDASPLPSTIPQWAPGLKTCLPRDTILRHLRSILQEASFQQDLLVNLINSINSAEISSREGSSGLKIFPTSVNSGSSDSRIDTLLERDRDSRQPSAEFENKFAYNVDELQGLNLRNIQQEHHILRAAKCPPNLREGREESFQGPVVSRKGRFSVTSEDVKLAENCLLHKLQSGSERIPERRCPGLLQLPASRWTTSAPIKELLPRLQTILHQATIQQDLLVDLIWSISTSKHCGAERLNCPGMKGFSKTVGVVRSAPILELMASRDRPQPLSELHGKIAQLADERNQC